VTPVVASTAILNACGTLVCGMGREPHFGVAEDAEVVARWALFGGNQGWLKIWCVPTRRHTMCASPSVTGSPYSNVARPSAAHVNSKIPVAP
jgi:hypothetical protein